MIGVKEDLCTGCRVCVLACAEGHGGAYHPDLARIRIETVGCTDTPLVCRQCPEAPCREACPLGALGRDERGAMGVDEGLCIGCGACEAACPFRAVTMAEGLPRICDLCQGAPRCVARCPSGALLQVRP